jgi:hypothetical protein
MATWSNTAPRLPLRACSIELLRVVRDLGGLQPVGRALVGRRRSQHVEGERDPAARTAILFYADLQGFTSRN